MLHVKVISFKSPVIQAIHQLESDYLTRLKRFSKLELIEINSSRFSKLSPTQLLEKENQLILEQIESGEYLIALSESGKQNSSEAMADWLEKIQTTGRSKLVFVLGSPQGLSKTLISKANYNLSLSPLTFTAQMARLILLEQLYRCFAINNNLPYHKAGI